MRGKPHEHRLLDCRLQRDHCGRVGDEHTDEHNAVEAVFATKVKLIEGVPGHQRDEAADDGTDAGIEDAVAKPAQEDPAILGEQTQLSVAYLKALQV